MRAVKVHVKKMTALFEAADENGNGRLDEEEFEGIIQDPACVAWLSARSLRGHCGGLKMRSRPWA